MALSHKDLGNTPKYSQLCLDIICGRCHIDAQMEQMYIQDIREVSKKLDDGT
jgi:hypothetical protein